MFERDKSYLRQMDGIATALMTILNILALSMLGLLFWSVYLLMKTSTIFAELLKPGLWS